MDTRKKYINIYIRFIYYILLKSIFCVEISASWRNNRRDDTDDIFYTKVVSINNFSRHHHLIIRAAA